jgi:membrane fusion protein (multidrug efflux system)
VRKTLVTVFVALVIAAAIGASHWHLNLRADSATYPQSSDRDRAVVVETAAVQTAMVSDEVNAVGTLRSNESVIVRPEIAGRIAAIHFDEGEPIERGQPLVSLEDSTHQAELADARASLNFAERTFERLDSLFDQGSVTARERDEARARLERARAAVQLARARLEKTDVNAPFSGNLGLRRVSPGDYVTPGQDMVNIEDIDPVKVDFRIPERFLSSLSVGQRIRVGVDAFPGRGFEGEVYAIDPQIDPAGRSIAIRARIDNPDQVLRPGLFARVRLILDERPEALVVPEQALVPDGEQRYVFRVRDGQARRTEVRIGQRRSGQVEIVDGLAAGDTVVTAGQLKLRDGTPITVKNAIGERDDGGSARQGDAA